MRIGIDVDGVLANFYAAYEALAIQTQGEDLFGEHKWPNETRHQTALRYIQQAERRAGAARALGGKGSGT